MNRIKFDDDGFTLKYSDYSIKWVKNDLESINVGDQFTIIKGQTFKMKKIVSN